MSYLLGDSDAAASRLALLAEVFAPSTVAFLAEAVKGRPRLVLDLGCGPGHTTRLLAGTLGADRTAGIDASGRFIRQAAGEPVPGVVFHRHDVTRVPFPEAPADVIYCRFLLIHLSDPPGVMSRWIHSGLKPGGRLLLEELERIETDNPSFRAYLRMVEAALAHQDNRLFVGPALAAAGPALAAEAEIEISRVRELAIPQSVAARMFYMNLPALREKSFIQENFMEEVTRLEPELRALAEGTVEAGDGVVWGLRQMALRKPALHR